jgi:phosphoserine aminotransferase
VRVFNFAAGPATLPLEVLEQARNELTDWRGSGMSVMEVSHRSKAFQAVAAELEAALRELLAVPAGYKVILLQGGATAQFAAIPLNLANAESTADYLNTGAWSKKAIGEAKRYCKVNIAADESASGYNSVPAQGALKLTPGAAFVHYTPNETIGGVEFGYVPQVGAVPLVADFSSTFLSRPLDVSRFGARRWCSTTRPWPMTAPCSTPHRPSPGTWPAWC